MTHKSQVSNIKYQTADSKDQVSNKGASAVDRDYSGLAKRMSLFGADIIRLCKEIPENIITRPLISQIIRSATSVGANYAEANNASSKKDFRNKIYISKKESQETDHWLNMLVAAEPGMSIKIAPLKTENHELCLILQSIANKIGDS